MDNEKKFKLEELPDKGSSSDQADKPKIKTFVKATAEPRLERLKGLGDRDRLEVLSQSWRFDRPVNLWGGIIVLVFLFVLQAGGFLPLYKSERKQLEEKSMGISEAFFPEANIDFLLRNPLLLAILVPFVFKLRKESIFYFELTFSGIKTVESLIIPRHQNPLRVHILWDEIVDVKKKMVNEREVLVLYNSQGAVGQLIWDIDEVKKKVIKRVLNGLISNKHPMRIFIEKEVT